MPPSMRPVLGGHVPPERVVGRDEFIDVMWNKLENDSIVLVSERRIGKTSVIFKMYKEPRKGWYPVYLVVEGVRSPTEFISKIVDEVSPILSGRGKAFSRLKKLYEIIAEGKYGDWSLPAVKDQWKKLLAAALNDIKENFDERMVFLWDELPLMISNIKDDHGEKMAMELLDVLRDHRVADDTGKLRMVFTGSIGLHLVVSELRHRGYRNDPTNDMVTLSLEGLSSAHAQELARQGLQGFMEQGVVTLADSIGDVAKTIAAATDRLPFYVNYTVDRLSETGRPIKVSDVGDAIDSILLDPNDPAHFRYYAERIEAYYQFDDKADDLAFEILNVLCRAEETLPEEALWDEVVAQIELTDRKLFHKVLDALMNDHYLTRTVKEERAYRFKYDVIRRWWLKNRG